MILVPWRRMSRRARSRAPRDCTAGLRLAEASASAGTWQRAAVACAADPVQFRAVSGDVRDPPVPFRRALARAGGPTADHERPRPVNQVADRHLLAVPSAVRARLVAVPPPGDHVLDEVADHRVGERLGGDVSEQDAPLPPGAARLGKHPQRGLVSRTEGKHAAGQPDHRLDHVIGEQLGPGILSGRVRELVGEGSWPARGRPRTGRETVGAPRCPRR